MNLLQLFFLLLAGAITLYGLWFWQNKTLQITHYTLQKQVDKPLRLLQISDLHATEFGRDNGRLFKKIQSLAPDLILVTGDTIGSQKQLPYLGKLTANLSKIATTVIISGNHESRNQLVSAQAATVKQAGGVFLQNEIATLSIKGQAVSLLGLCEKQGNYTDIFTAIKPTAAMSAPHLLFETLKTQEGLKILLSHFPENFDALGQQSYSQFDFDVMFAGHAHGGQVRLFGQGIIAPGQGIFPKYTAGVWQNRLIISRGLGNSSIPLRIFNRPELVLAHIIPRNKEI